MDPGTAFWMDVSDAKLLITYNENNEKKCTKMKHTKKKKKLNSSKLKIDAHRGGGKRRGGLRSET